MADSTAAMKRSSHISVSHRAKFVRNVLVRRIGAPANLTYAYPHSHLPVLAALLLEQGPHRVSGPTPLGELGHKGVQMTIVRKGGQILSFLTHVNVGSFSSNLGR